MRSPGLRWSLLRWLRRRQWFVLETADEALLCSLRSSWGFFRSWEIVDAEHRLVCTYSGNFIFDNRGRIEAVIDKDGFRGGWKFLSRDGCELGTVYRTPEATELLFTEMIRNAPFAKMGLLGATLAATDSRIVNHSKQVLQPTVEGGTRFLC
ncbi:MAG: hypothetical protein ACFCD0_00505 [Gemmataceae bacterium]